MNKINNYLELQLVKHIRFIIIIMDEIAKAEKIELECKNIDD